jgi:hypothetical protein
MAEFTIRYGALEIGAPSMKQLATLLDALPDFIERLKEHAPKERAPKALAFATPHIDASEVEANLQREALKKDGPNCAAYQQLTTKRFRMNNEELAEFGDQRERAAYYRLKAIRPDLVTEIPGVTDDTQTAQSAKPSAKGESEELDLGELALPDDEE